MYLLAGDEVVVTKAGKQTYGLDRFFSSLYGKPVSGLSFFTLSLISIQQRHSYPIRIKQVIKSEVEKSKQLVEKSPKLKDKHGRGRPKGSKNKNKAQVTLTPELLRIKSMISALFELLVGKIGLTYLVLDGHFGNHNALQMARLTGLHLISKLRCDSALYLPYQNPGAERCSRRKYGNKLDYNPYSIHLPVQ